MSYRSSPDKTKKTLQNKVLDGGIAGDSSIIILPKNTTSGLDEITSEVGLLAYDTTQNEIVVDKGSGWEVVGGGGGDGGVLTVDPVGSSPNANGATISGTALILQPADATNPGIISTGTQSFLGNKTIEGQLVVNPGATDGYASKVGTMYLSQFGSASAYFANGASFDGGGWHNYLSTGVGIIELSSDGNTRFFNNSGLNAPPDDFSPALRMVIAPNGVVQMPAYTAGFAKFDGSGNLAPVLGASGTFTTTDLKTVTVVDGLITSIV